VRALSGLTGVAEWREGAHRAFARESGLYRTTRVSGASPAARRRSRESRRSPSARRRSGWQQPARRAGGSACGLWAARRAVPCWWPMIPTPSFSGRSMPAPPGSPGFAASTAGVWAGSLTRSGTSGRSASRSGTGRRPEIRRPAAHPAQARATKPTYADGRRCTRSAESCPHGPTKDCATRLALQMVIWLL
jgi:hypothetical protein